MMQPIKTANILCRGTLEIYPVYISLQTFIVLTNTEVSHHFLTFAIRVVRY